MAAQRPQAKYRDLRPPRILPQTIKLRMLESARDCGRESRVRRKLMFEKILFPLDGSDLAEAVQDRVILLAKRLGAKVLLVQAVDSLTQRLATVSGLEPPGAVGVNVEMAEKAMSATREAAGHYLARVKARMASEGVDAETFIGEGNPSEVILNLAQTEAADLIAMTTHGRGGLGRLVFGSVSDAVLRHSTVPVLLLRSTAK